MGCASLYGGHVCGRAYAFNGGYMTDVELVSLCAVAMALFNLFLIHQLNQARRATAMAWEILVDTAKGDISLVWDEANKTIKPVKPQ